MVNDGFKKDLYQQSNEKQSLRSKKKNYKKYYINLRDIALITGTALLLTIAIAWLFYRSFYGLILFPMVWLVLFFRRKNIGIQRQQQELRIQFKECIRVVTASLYTGYSIENAFIEAEKELTHLLGIQEAMCLELQNINQQIKLNIPVEKLLQDLADRSGVEEILNFGHVFRYARRNGSDFPRILKDTTDRITEKTELEQEIGTLVAAKQLEQKIMNVIPMGILFFVDITSPGFLEIMYKGVFGRIIMSIFLLLYAGAYLLSEKIVNIEI